MVNDSRSEGIGYDLPVVDEDHGANGGEQVPVTEVRAQFLVPVLAVLGESYQDGRVEQLVLWAGSAGGLQHGPGDGGSKQLRGVVEFFQPGHCQAKHKSFSLVLKLVGYKVGGYGGEGYPVWDPWCQSKLGGHCCESSGHCCLNFGRRCLAQYVFFQGHGLCGICT